MSTKAVVINLTRHPVEDGKVTNNNSAVPSADGRLRFITKDRAFHCFAIDKSREGDAV